MYSKEKCMGNKEEVSSREISRGLILYFILFNFLFGFIYSFGFSLLSEHINSMMIMGIISVIAQGIITFTCWKISVSTVFKNKTMPRREVANTMRNIVIFTVIVCIINGVYQLSNVNKTIDEGINSDYGLKYKEHIISQIYDGERLQEYYKQKEEAIEKAKKQAYTYLLIIEIGFTITYLAVLPLVRKDIIKHVEKDENNQIEEMIEI